MKKTSIEKLFQESVQSEETLWTQHFLSKFEATAIDDQLTRISFDAVPLQDVEGAKGTAPPLPA